MRSSALEFSWWLRHRQGIFRVWILLSAIWIIGSIFSSPPNDNLAIKAYSSPSSNFNSFRNKCVKNSIEVIGGNFGTVMIDYYNFINYMSSLGPRPYSPYEAAQRRKWEAELKDFNRKYVTYKARYNYDLEKAFQAEVRT